MKGTILLLAAAFSLAAVLAFGPAAALARAQGSLVEKAYLDKSAAIEKGNASARIELAKWCRDRGYVREMLKELDLILAADPECAAARSLRLQEKKGDGWIYAPPPAVKAPAEPPSEPRELAARRKKLLQAARTKAFKLVKKAAHFNFWSDLDGKRVESYTTVMNPYYNSLRGFFRITRSARDVAVIVFAKRSDYLEFYRRSTGKSGEHVGGYYAYNGGNPYLCFYDAPRDPSVFETARHECTHLLLRQCLRGEQTAHWLDEGMACYFAAGGDDWKGSYAADCLMTARRLARLGKAPALRELMSTPYKEFGFNHYALSWSWILYLRRNPETRKGLKRLLLKLRQRAAKLAKSAESGQSGGGEERGDEFAGVSDSLFRECVGPPERLQTGWRDFAEKEGLLPETDEQRYRCAEWCFNTAGGWAKPDPLPSSNEKRELLRTGEKWLFEAAQTPDRELRKKCRLARVDALLARVRCMDYDFEETAYAAIEAGRILEAFLEDPENRELTSEAGILAHASALSLRKAGEFDCPEGEACDFAALFAERRKDSEEELEAAARNPARKESAEKELALLPLAAGAADEAIVLARSGYARALSLDPAYREAAFQWLRLALDFSPADLDPLFPHLVFQAELDPDDAALAALAAVYAVKGKKPYAKTLLQRARDISPDKDRLEYLAAYVEP